MLDHCVSEFIVEGTKTKKGEYRNKFAREFTEEGGVIQPTPNI